MQNSGFLHTISLTKMKRGFMLQFWSVVAFLPLLVNCQSNAKSNACIKKEKNLALLDLADESISKAKEHIPDCSENTTQSNTSDCSKRGKSLAFLEIAENLISEVKGNYSTCVESTSIVLKQTPMDCSEILKNGQNESGIYTIWPRSRISYNKSLEVYCDMETDSGGWTVIQRRGNYSNQEDFFRNWVDYKTGFGNITRDFWIGNDNIFILSNQGEYEIRFDLEDGEGNKAFATYQIFWIDDEKMNYTLHIGNYSGNAGDSMGYHDGQKFTTKDRQNDKSASRSCAIQREGAWWYYNCTNCNLNGIYKPGRNGKFKGVFWRTWKSYESMAVSEIKLRPKQGVMQTFQPPTMQQES